MSRAEQQQRDGCQQAFTLMEVMIAVAILGVALTAIFSSEVVATKVGYRARDMSIATSLARCKMGEVEEQMMTDGFPSVEASGRDVCCEDAEVEGFSCEWKVERVVLPSSVGTDEEDEEGSSEGEEAAPTGAEIGAAAGVTSLDELMAGGTGAGGGGLASTAMTYAYPIIKPAIEEQVRRATVTVRWKSAFKEQSFDVVQYLVAESGIATGQGDEI